MSGIIYAKEDRLMESLHKYQVDSSLTNTARRVTKETTSFGYWVGRAFFRPELNLILFTAYAYFRWLDDIIDQENISREAASRLVARQRSLTRAWYAGSDPFPSNQFEALLQGAIEYDRMSEYRLHHMIHCFLSALAWDAERRHTIVTQQDLDRYSLHLGRAYAEGLLFGLGLNPVCSDYRGPRDLCGTAAHLTHLLRDLFIDLELGYVNISSRDMERFCIDIADPELRGTKQWVMFTIERAHTLFLQGRRHRDGLPTMRARLVFDIACLRYLWTLKRIKNMWLRAEILPRPKSSPISRQVNVLY
jgi:phytoene/squalene synthetase